MSSRRGALEKVLRAADHRGGVLIPSFAIGRTQELLFPLKAQEQEKAIPDLPVYVDSAWPSTPLLPSWRTARLKFLSRIVRNLA
jgi:predicted metal-dependent RNase